MRAIATSGHCRKIVASGTDAQQCGAKLGEAKTLDPAGPLFGQRNLIYDQVAALFRVMNFNPQILA